MTDNASQHATPATGSTAYLQAIWAIVWKDLTMELRTRQSLTIMAVFSVAAVLVFNFALELELDAARNVSTGLLWIVILLAGTLGLNRTAAVELENRSIDAVLAAPVARSAIYLGKVLSASLFVLALEALLLPLFIIFFNKPYWLPQVMLITLEVNWLHSSGARFVHVVQTSGDVLLPGSHHCRYPQPAAATASVAL